MIMENCVAMFVVAQFFLHYDFLVIERKSKNKWKKFVSLNYYLEICRGFAIRIKKIDIFRGLREHLVGAN